MPEGSIGGKYKTIEDADKGIAELEATLAKITSERDKAANLAAELAKPKPPAFADDAGFEKHITGKIDPAAIYKKALTEKVYDPKDMAAIGEALKEADPKWLGETFARFRVVTAVAEVEKAQAAQIEKFGKDRFQQMLDWHGKNADGKAKEAFAARWNSATTAEDAAKNLFADFTLNQAPRSPAEQGVVAAGGAPGGFTSPAELKAAREASRRAHGFDHYKTDTAYLQRLSQTPENIKTAAT
ncbi:MAG TPA: hypothetical protein VEB22_06890 [Phycisphaerales bacterium]|nr:hypothetical protein [Phycisphaerales bacterium]